MADSPSTPNIKIQLTNITLNKDIPVNVRIVYWNCDEEGYVETQMPSNDSNQYRRSALWKIIKKARRFRQITIQILPMKSVYIMLVLLHIPEPQNYTNSDLGTIRENRIAIQIP